MADHRRTSDPVNDLISRIRALEDRLEGLSTSVGRLDVAPLRWSVQQTDVAGEAWAIHLVNPVTGVATPVPGVAGSGGGGGVAGPRGASGPAGAAGAAGPTGATGAAGPTGATGASGGGSFAYVDGGTASSVFESMDGGGA